MPCRATDTLWTGRYNGFIQKTIFSRRRMHRAKTKRRTKCCVKHVKKAIKHNCNINRAHHTHGEWKMADAKLRNEHIHEQSWIYIVLAANYTLLYKSICESLIISCWRITRLLSASCANVSSHKWFKFWSNASLKIHNILYQIVSTANAFQQMKRPVHMFNFPFRGFVAVSNISFRLLCVNIREYRFT